MAVASLVLGIIALILSFIPGINIWAIIIGLVGLILGALGMKNPAKKGMATAGLVMSIIAVALSVIVWIACIACVSAASADLAALDLYY